MGEDMGVGGLVLWVGAGILMHAGFLLWGARIAGIEKRTYGKCLTTTVLSCLAMAIPQFLLTEPGLLFELGLFASGFFVTAWLTMVIFDAEFGQAFKAAVYAWLCSIAVPGAIILVVMSLT